MIKAISVLFILFFAVSFVSAGIQLNFNDTSGGGGNMTLSFLDLSDTPSSYTGQGGQFVAVNGAENGLEFVSASTFDGNETWSMSMVRNKFPAGWTGGIIYASTGGIFASPPTMGFVYPYDVYTSQCIRLNVDSVSAFFLSATFSSALFKDGSVQVSTITSISGITGPGTYEACSNTWELVPAGEVIGNGYSASISTFGESMAAQVITTILLKKEVET